ncbi:hypothetical protein L596_028181 [Steinernema carpocapsae]|uniref:Rab-GAP TBC domain-containing protein n=1 Tax=Steinernema carpocapsae TaxID=34508 RepID=A0A4U5LXP0_STECR|nr:hypothetical protein L596_028181 [Steinernema carpocapsae]
MCIAIPLIEIWEREAIVKEYDAGPRSSGTEPWENPDFELLKNKDRFGFIRKEGAHKIDRVAEKRHSLEESRNADKFDEALKLWPSDEPTPPKIVEHVWIGIPDCKRGKAWIRLLDVEALRQRARKGMYEDLLARARLVCPDMKLIDLDIVRTFRNHVEYRKRCDLKQRALFNVLIAYAMFNTEVGYCQGMSQIAALFLMYMDEEDAFWCLHSLMIGKKYGMHGFFVHGFPKLMRFQAHYEKVLHSHLPRVKKHLVKVITPAFPRFT